MHFDSLPEWLYWQEHFHPKPIDLGLERIAKVLRALNPEGIRPPTVTVAGTNGKGSCVALLEAIYRAQGYRVGAYTSPHILKYNERIRIDGHAAEDARICAAFERIEALRGSISLSYFEFGTLAALDLFWRAAVDVQLLEVGLGGRLDAVNIVDADAAIVTSIGIDHSEWLGATREAIGAEKAGIFRSGKPAIISDPEPPASLVHAAFHTSGQPWRIGSEFTYRKHAQSWDWLAGAKHHDNLPYPALKGEHQLRNAAAALMAIETLQGSLPVSTSAISQGLRQVDLPGRFQLITSDAVPVLLDVGHNPQAAQTLHEHLASYYSGRRIRAVFAMMRDKDIKGVIEIMHPLVDEWYITPLANPRAADPEVIRSIFEAGGIGCIHTGFQDVSAAFAAARAGAGREDLIVIFGSFFLVSEYLSRLVN